MVEVVAELNAVSDKNGLAIESKLVELREFGGDRVLASDASSSCLCFAAGDVAEVLSKCGLQVPIV
jgi:hypothetical protein